MAFTFERSADTDRLIIALSGVNGEISYQSLAAQVSLPAGRVKQLLPSARRAMMRKNVMFGTVRGVGIKRLSEREKIDKTDQTKKRISRAARRGSKEINTIDLAKLSNVDQLRVTTIRTIFHLISAQTAPVREFAAPRQSEPAATPNIAKLVLAK